MRLTWAELIDQINQNIPTNEMDHPAVFMDCHHNIWWIDVLGKPEDVMDQYDETQWEPEERLKYVTTGNL